MQYNKMDNDKIFDNFKDNVFRSKSYFKPAFKLDSVLGQIFFKYSIPLFDSSNRAYDPITL